MSATKLDEATTTTTNNIPAKDIKEVREATKLGVAYCKEMLRKADGNVTRAIQLAFEFIAANRGSDDELHEGLIFTYSHNGKFASIVELRTRTDFASRSQEFVELGNALARELVAKLVIGADMCLTDRVAIDCILENTSSVRTPSVTLKEMINNVSQVLGEPIRVGRLVAWNLRY